MSAHYLKLIESQIKKQHYGSQSKSLCHLGLCPHRPKLAVEFVVCEDTDHGAH